MKNFVSFLQGSQDSPHTPQETVSQGFPLTPQDTWGWRTVVGWWGRLTVLNLHTGFWLFGLGLHHVSLFSFLQLNLALNSAFMSGVSILFPNTLFFPSFLFLPNTSVLVMNKIFSPKLWPQSPPRVVCLVRFYSWTNSTRTFCLQLFFRQTNASFVFQWARSEILWISAKMN